MVSRSRALAATTAALAGIVVGAPAASADACAVQETVYKACTEVRRHVAHVRGTVEGEVAYVLNEVEPVTDVVVGLADSAYATAKAVADQAYWTIRCDVLGECS